MGEQSSSPWAPHSCDKVFETLSSGGPSHWPRSILGQAGFVLAILGAAFNLLVTGVGTLLLVITGDVLAIVDRGVKKEPDPLLNSQSDVAKIAWFCKNLAGTLLRAVNSVDGATA